MSLGSKATLFLFALATGSLTQANAKTLSQSRQLQEAEDEDAAFTMEGSDLKINLGNILEDLAENFDEIQEEVQTFVESEQFQNALKEVELAFEKARPEVQAWLDEHWRESWLEDSGDRWDTKNLEQGWDLEEVRQEFREFFEQNDAGIVNDQHQDSDKFQAELKQTMSLYNLGIKSGKVTNEENWNNDNARFQKLYDIALVSARQSELRSSGSGQEPKVNQGLFSNEEFVAIAVLIALLLAVTTMMGICWHKKRKREQTLSRIEDQASEMQEQPQFQLVPDEITMAKSGHQAAYPQTMQAIRDVRRARQKSIDRD